MTGSLPSVASVKKAVLTLAAAAAWFLPAHFVILALLVFVWGSAMASTTNTAKTRGLETRVNGVVTQLGTTNANVTTAQNTANNALPKSGGTISGSLTVTGSCTVQGNFGCQSNGTVSGALGVNTLSIQNNAFMPNGSLGSAPAPPSGTATGPTYAGNFYTGSGAQVWAAGISNKVDAIISALSVNGITP